MPNSQALIQPMPRALGVDELFISAGLKLSDPVPWKTAIPETQMGIYVVETDLKQIDVNRLAPSERHFWNPGQSIVYIGCTKRSLRLRLNQFY